ncbi:MAG: AraC family transcriptional regulator [Deltaproteobacteria bacterium]|nr:AraC family transcriptional regulator [Deltaproteobacteria bacterium]
MALLLWKSTGPLQAEFLNGDPSLEVVSKRMGTSTRSLQRKLAEHGLNYRNLIQKIRQELAASYLNNNQFNINDVSLMLGYSEASTFTTAFRKWHGITPSNFRKKHQKQPPA